MTKHEAKEFFSEIFDLKYEDIEDRSKFRKIIQSMSN